ncbi:MAG: DNA internalization-related competence protein ComEC/Rec2 [Aliidiomarina sp.]|uniref:DNA internalization-related competence protein ComEC/Rec2 n=1 Tax=Aliidiomarina sp. TaxID=1872439 RepID=UPI0025B99A19|nr:DNA internalization-related competence protein ComEC/Rec2 [Aliidiomarina sp.]MCH8500511.1 DNA internalization-related competence protein ComEC/Rec2 [Aliidiomarina sp.]
MKLHIDAIACAVIAAVLSMAWMEPDSWVTRLAPLAFLSVSVLLFKLKICTVSLFFSVFAFAWWGAYAFMLAQLNLQPDADQSRQPQYIQVQVTSIATQRGDTIRFTGRWQVLGQESQQRILVTWFRSSGSTLPVPQVGETWWLQARMRPISARANQGGFDYQSYLVRNKIWLTASVSRGERLHVAQRVSYRQYLYNRLQPLRASADSPAGLHYLDIVLGLTLGERHWLSAERRQLLVTTGVAHVMAISGLHVSLVFAVSWWLAKVVLVLLWRGDSWLLRLRWRQVSRQPDLRVGAIMVALVCAGLYAAMSGFAVSTVRALVLLTLVALVRLFGRRLSMAQILLRCIAVVLVVDPLAWLDAGFWLSVCAVAAIFFSQWWQPTQQENRRPTSVLARTTQLWRLEIVLTVLIAPLMILYFHGISLIAPLTNLLVIPVFAVLILPMSFIALGLLALPHAVFNHVAVWLLTQLDPVLHTVFTFLASASNWPQAWFSTTDVRWALLGIMLWMVGNWQQSRQTQWLMVSLLVAGLPFITLPQQEQFTVHVLDVGQGSAIVIQRGNKALLYDAGPGFIHGSHLADDVILPFLRFRRLQPEWLVISHEHLDHTGAAAALQQRFPALKTLRSRFAFDATSDWGWQPEAFPEHITRHSQPCSWGQNWLWQGVQIRALAPLPGPSFGPNNDSCVLQLSYAGQVVLLTGDIQRHTELRMVGRYAHKLRANVMVIPHHGSQTSSQIDFIAAVQPDIAVVSRGFMNQFRMPHEDVLERYQSRQIPLYDTGRDGQVSLSWEEARWWRGEKEGRWRVRSYYQFWRNRWYARRLPEWQR